MTVGLTTRVLAADAAGIDVAARTLRDGGLLAFPTETVYGLGADATNAVAVARLFAAKGRPSFNPLIAHVGDPADARRLAQFNDDAMRLSRFWPGPLTLVLSVVSLVVSGAFEGSTNEGALIDVPVVTPRA